MVKVPGPEDFSAYTKMGNSVSVYNSLSQNQTFDTIYSNLTRNGGNGYKYHKSLDFSNVGMPIQGDAMREDSEAKLRQFHQTRLYIMDYNGMLHHNKRIDEKSNNPATYLVSANLPESFSYQVGSKWSAPLSFGNSALANALMQLGGSEVLNVVGNKISNLFGGGDINLGDKTKSLSGRLTTLQVWNGSDPLELTLRIPVIDDGHPNGQNSSVGKRTNLVEALEFLGSLCLPKYNKSSAEQDFGFYTPPPSPFEFNLNWTDSNKNRQSSSLNASTPGRIMLQLGGILLIDNIIVKSVNVEYPNTKGLIRHWYNGNINPGEGFGSSTYLTPLLANVTITVSTAEAITADNYSKMLWLKQDADPMFSENTDNAFNAVSSIRSNVEQRLSNLTNTVSSALQSIGLDGKMKFPA